MILVERGGWTYDLGTLTDASDKPFSPDGKINRGEFFFISPDGRYCVFAYGPSEMKMDSYSFKFIISKKDGNQIDLLRAEDMGIRSHNVNENSVRWFLGIGIVAVGVNFLGRRNRIEGGKLLVDLEEGRFSMMLDSRASGFDVDYDVEKSGFKMIGLIHKLRVYGHLEDYFVPLSELKWAELSKISHFDEMLKSGFFDIFLQRWRVG